MLRSSGRFSAFALLWAVLQFALPTSLAFLDSAIAERGAGRASVHVEEAPGKGCQPPHSSDCAICRHLSTSVGVAARVDGAAWPTRAHAASAGRAPRQAGEVVLALPQSRAPPGI